MAVRDRVEPASGRRRTRSTGWSWPTRARARRQFHRDRGPLDPRTDPSTIDFGEEKVKEWLSKGTTPSNTVSGSPEGERRWLAARASRAAARRRTGCVQVEEVQRDGADRPPAPRREGRRRQGDRPPGPDRARTPGDRRASAARSHHRVVLGIRVALACRRGALRRPWRLVRRSKRCSPRSSESRSTRSSSAVTCSSGRPPRSRRSSARSMPPSSRGNCDREPDNWTTSKLDDEILGWSEGWPLTVEHDGVLLPRLPRTTCADPTDASPPSASTRRSTA